MCIHRRDAEIAERSAEKTNEGFAVLCVFLCVLCASALKRISRWARGLCSCTCPLGPGLGRGSGFDFGHGDAVLHWADQPAEIAADTFGFIDAGNARGGRGASGGTKGFGFGDGGYGDGRGRIGFVEMDALVGSVPTGDVAEIAADAGIAVDAGYDAVVEIEVLPLGDFGDSEAAEIFDGAEAFLVHPVAQAIDHVFHDAVAVVRSE